MSAIPSDAYMPYEAFCKLRLEPVREDFIGRGVHVENIDGRSLWHFMDHCGVDCDRPIPDGTKGVE